MNRTIIDQPQVPGGIVIVEWDTNTGYPFPAELPPSVIPGYLADPRPLTERGYMGFPLSHYGVTVPETTEAAAAAIWAELRRQDTSGMFGDNSGLATDTADLRHVVMDVYDIDLHAVARAALLAVIPNLLADLDKTPEGS